MKIQNQATSHSDQELLRNVIEVVKRSGDILTTRFHSLTALPKSLSEIQRMLSENDEAVTSFLRPALKQIRPQAEWVEDEGGTGPLLEGEWWVVDPAEGNINHIHKMDDWCVSVTLVRSNEIIFTVVYVPLTKELFTAHKGFGAFRNGTRIEVSDKQELQAALVGTGQALPFEGDVVFKKISDSVNQMLKYALVQRVSVPATMQLILVASGKMDGFWQYSQVRSGLLAGALLVQEAGGSITDTQGHRWTLSSPDFLATTQLLKKPMVRILSKIN